MNLNIHRNQLDLMIIPMVDIIMNRKQSDKLLNVSDYEKIINE